MDMSKTNIHRANRSRELVTIHMITQLENQEIDDTDECLESSIASMLSDLRHLCELKGLEFQPILDLSREHYRDEANGMDNYLDEPEEACATDGIQNTNDAATDLLDLIFVSYRESAGGELGEGLEATERHMFNALTNRDIFH